MAANNPSVKPRGTRPLDGDRYDRSAHQAIRLAQAVIIAARLA